MIARSPIERSYRLTPMQQGMLFQGLSAPDDGVYVAQTVCKLPLDVDLRAFEQAWRSVINRHDILRTCFLWQGLSEPLQKVCEGISVPIEIEDWTRVPVTDQNDLLQSLLLRERKRGFDFSTAPLMRITLLKLAGDEHLFLWTHHHILLDGRSRLIVMKEVSLFYEAYRRNQKLELPPPPSYADYVDWFYRQDQSDAEQYWWKLLETFRTPTKLRVPWESDAEQSGERYQTRHFSLPPEVKDSLQLLAQSNKLTINWIVQAAWAVLLSRYSGQEDVVFGETRSGRRTDFENVGSVVGLLINTVPIRLHVEGSKTFLNLLQELRDQHVAMRPYECTPLTRIRAGSGLDRAAELFQSLVAFDEYSPGSALQREGCDLWSGGVTRLCPVHYPLAVAGFSKPDLSLRIEYDRRSYSDEAVGRLVGHLATLLEEATRDPHARIADLSLLTETEQQALKQWNRTAVDYAADACVHLLVEKQVRMASDAIAVVFEGDVLTYAELNRRANQLAHYLRRLGVGPDARVAICAERSLEMITGLLGTLKAGGAYVPLDPAYPAERLRYMLEDCAPLVVLTQPHLRSLFAGIGEELPVLNLDEATLWAGQPETNPKWADVGHRPANLAYVIYTSGSTGAPKGVAIEHRSLLNLICWTRKSFEVERSVRSSSVAGFGFDAFTLEVWPALCAGATLLLPPPMVARDPAALLAWWESKEPEISFLPTPIAELAFAQGITNARQRILLVGGDVLHRLPAQVPPFMVVNNYGPTEATVVATSGPVEDNAVEPTIGRPIANTQIYILDQHRQLVPMGVAGELYIGGVGVGRGYLGRPEQTAERFVADPFVESGGRMYRSGDLARWREDGRIEFLGRNDFQVKIRGYRIELGEIEARLAEHAGVGEVVVMAREATVGDKRLVAYYTTVEANEEGLGAEELRAYLGDKLPEYMLPTAYVRLERLPLTPNGKVDRQALPAPAGDAYVARGYEAPVGESERALASIWADMLKVERVGRYDNFFELGGHSLLAMQVISQLRHVLGVEVATKDLFAHPVLIDFARVVERTPRAALPAITLAERGKPLPLCFAQQRLWFLAQMEGVSEAYHIFCGWRLKGELDRRALDQALDRIVARHEALRTTCELIDGQPMQRIIAAEESRFRLVECELKEAKGREEELNRLVTEEASAGFDLEQGPLIRGQLIGLGENDHALLLTMHHIVSDGWSMDIFIKELSTLYEAFARGQEDPLPPLTVQYADYAVWQREWLQGEVLRRQAEYWQQALAGAPALLELPTDHVRPAVQEYVGGSVELELEEGLTRKLKELSQRAGTTLYMTLLAGWSLLLAWLSGQDDIVVGTPVANRGRVEIEGLIGFFVNTLALRLNVSGSPTVTEMLQRVKEQTLAAQQHQDIPFEQIVELVRPARSLAHNPLFQVMFDWSQWTQEGRLELIGLEAQRLQSARMVAKFDLRLCLQESGGRIVGRLEYATALFERETAERYVNHWRTLLKEMVADDMQAVDRLPLLGEAERHQVLVEWNATEVFFPKESSVHELFEAQAEKRPDAIAVVDENQNLTYSGLNAQANRLAHHLRGLGVGPDARVAIILDRSMALVVAELAVLKCSAAYVPIDPTFPGERQVFMALDCAAQVVITTRDAALPEALAASRVNINDFTRLEEAVENLSLPSHGEMTAYVMYTSGSTGQPKGVMVPHRAITRLVFNCGYADFKSDDRVAFAANPAFDAATMEVWAPLLNGGRMVVIDPDCLLEPSMFAEALIAQEVSVLWMTVGLFNQYVHQLGEAFGRLRYLIVGGDVLDPRTIAEVLSHAPPRHLVNGYGPTETTTFAITHEITEVSEATRSIPLGNPISNTQCYILDENHRPSPLGVGGEIYIGGLGVAHGYLNRPELTAERFRPDPFGREPGARLYKTGDLGRWLPGGEVEFLGRNDLQVKIRGFRVELGEIEARLTSHPAVCEAVVLAYDADDAGKRLVAYFTGQEIAAEALRSYLSGQLPEYMLPTAYVRLERLPLTPNGKVDRQALPAPAGDAYVARGYEAPVGESERALASIWADMLKVERVGRYDNFFELGGHSLLATRVVNRIRTTLGVEFSVRTLFEAPTLSEMAKRLKSSEVARIPLRPIMPQVGIQPE